jgi:hypothetical protein
MAPGPIAVNIVRRKRFQRSATRAESVLFSAHPADRSGQAQDAAIGAAIAAFRYSGSAASSSPILVSAATQTSPARSSAFGVG